MQSTVKKRNIVFVLIVVLGIGADLWTKQVMFDWLGMPGGDTYWVIDSFFGFQISLNEGALFGMGQGMVPLFAAFSVVAAVGISFWQLRGGASREWLLTIALSMIMAGIFGNLYDRLGMHQLIWNYANPPLHEFGTPVYAVRDWIRFDFGSYTWPNFNIADALLVCGAILLTWHAFFGMEPEKAEETADTEESNSKKDATTP